MFDPSDTLVYLGDAVKALDDAGKVGGYLVRFGSADEPDLQGEYFDKSTYFGPAEKAMLLYHHGRDPVVGPELLGEVALKADDVGIWAEGQIAKADAYAAKIKALLKAGKLRWSSGSSPTHVLMDAAKGGARHIARWPIVEASLTPTPVEFRGTGAVALKALLDACKGEHLGQHAEHEALAAALDHLGMRARSAVVGHLIDHDKPRKAKLAACKATYAEHHAAAMKAIDAMLPGDGSGDESPAAAAKREAMKAWLAAHSPSAA